MTDLSVVVVNWNTQDLLAKCIRSVLGSASDLDAEVIVVDNASVDGSADLVRDEFPWVKLIANVENVGFARANNQALDRCKGRFVLLLNSDTEVLPDSLSQAVRFMDRHPGAGIAGVRLLNPDGTFQASYTPFPTLWRELLILSTLGRRLIRPAFPSYGPRIEGGNQRIDGYVEGAFLLIRRTAVDQVGKLDEELFMYAEEVDWCYRFHRAGWQVWYLPQVAIIHHGGQSSKKRRGRMEAELYRSRVCFFDKHYGTRAASSLKALIYGMTICKIVAYEVLCSVTGGRRGRSVTSWSELRSALNGTRSTADGRTV